MLTNAIQSNDSINHWHYDDLGPFEILRKDKKRNSTELGKDDLSESNKTEYATPSDISIKMHLVDQSAWRLCKGTGG